MKALLIKASDDKFIKNIEVKTLEEIFTIYRILILDKSKSTLDMYKNDERIDNKDFEIVITIYDDYIE